MRKGTSLIPKICLGVDLVDLGVESQGVLSIEIIFIPMYFNNYVCSTPFNFIFLKTNVLHLIA